MESRARHRAIALENAVLQPATLRTHRSGAAGLAEGSLRRHGRLFEIEAGAGRRFPPVVDAADPPTAQQAPGADDDAPLPPAAS